MNMNDQRPTDPAQDAAGQETNAGHIHLTDGEAADRPCPLCSGTGHHGRWPDTVPRPSPEAQPRCWVCHGLGLVPEGTQWSPSTGRAIRDGRQARGVTLREEARRLGISAAILSEQERGLWRVPNA
jgi:hypothetical protein